VDGPGICALQQADESSYNPDSAGGEGRRALEGSEEGEVKNHDDGS